jgi:adenylate cyclase
MFRASSSGHALLSIVHNFDYINDWSASLERSAASFLAHAQLAVTLDDAEPLARTALASAYLWGRDYDKALREAYRARALDPNFPGAHIVLGVALHYSGRSEEALGCFDRVLTLDPFYPDVYMHLQAQALYQLGRFPEAAALLKRRILRNPDTDSSRMLLAAAYGQMGQSDEAREAWRGLQGVMSDSEFRIEFDCALEQRSRLCVRLLRRSLPQRAAARIAIVGFQIVGTGRCDAFQIARGEIERQRGDDLGGYFVLHGKDVG